jgi:hypothetical protein
LSLEAFLDRSIVSGFSFGAEKAQVLVQQGKLLGHEVGRFGSRPDGERVKAIVDFAPLKEKLHIQQFLGCTNWLRWYLPKEYAGAAKVLGEYQKVGAEFPPVSLGGGGGCRGDVAVKVIKKMVACHIELSVLDEAAAIDGSRPLANIGDSCGMAWGGCSAQMTPDLSRFKMLMTAGKGLTPAQQAWAPLVLEAYAQLETKRAQRKMLGSMRSICWTDHANETKQQTAPTIDVKMLRWISEIISDGSQIRSLAGRTARLADGISRNPINWDALMAQRSKDLEGMVGQLRGFNLEEYLGDWPDGTYAMAWTTPSFSVRDRESTLEKYTPKPVEDTALAVARSYGVAPRLMVLYLGDYVSPSDREVCRDRVRREVMNELPGWEFEVAAIVRNEQSADCQSSAQARNRLDFVTREFEKTHSVAQ